MLLSPANLFALEDLEVTSNISEIGGDYLVVQEYTFYVDQNTVLKDADGNTVTFSYFQINDLVEVKGNSFSNGTFLATRVRLEDGPNNQNEIEVTGYVSSLGINSINIGSNTFFVDENTEFRGRHGNPFSFEQIEVGMLLEIKALSQSNGDFLATRVKSEDDHHHGNELEVKGIIENKSSNSITVATKEFFINGYTQIRDHNGAIISFDVLNVGDLVEVKVFRQPDSTYLAVRIKLEDIPGNEIEFTAQIESINGTDITINGITFATDSNTIFLDENRMPITIDFLEVGTWVEVKGFKRTDGSYYASRIQIEDFVQNEIEIKGNIIEITSDYLIVHGLTFTVDNNTVVMDHSNNIIPYSSLQAGQLIEVKGIKTGETTAYASLIKLEDNEDTEVFGLITSININSIELNGIIIFVNSNTIYLNHSNQQISVEDLRVDQFIEVKMITNLDGTLLALRIKIEDSMNFSKVNGFIGTITGNSIQLPSGIYSLTSQTVVIDKNNNLINVSQLTKGGQVIVWGSMDGSSNMTAMQIQSKANTITGVEENPVVADEFTLEQNYPNPFNPSTTISFTIQTDQFVSLRVFNTIGEEVKTLVNENLTKGTYKINFNSDGLSTGFYIYRLDNGNQMQVRKMIFLK